MVVLHCWSVWQESFNVSWLNCVNSSNPEWGRISPQSDLSSHWDLMTADKGREGGSGDAAAQKHRMEFNFEMFAFQQAACESSPFHFWWAWPSSGIPWVSVWGREPTPWLKRGRHRLKKYRQWWRVTFTQLCGELVWETKEKEKRKALICLFVNRCWRILGTFLTMKHLKSKQRKFSSALRRHTDRPVVLHICEIFMHEVWESVGGGGGGGSVRSANRGSSDFAGLWLRHASRTLWFLFQTVVVKINLLRASNWLELRLV